MIAEGEQAKRQAHVARVAVGQGREEGLLAELHGLQEHEIENIERDHGGEGRRPHGEEGIGLDLGVDQGEEHQAGSADIGDQRRHQ